MTQIPLSVELRFLQIPAVWRLVKYHVDEEFDHKGRKIAEAHEEHVFVPSVEQSPAAVHARKLVEVKDEEVWELRNSFLRMKHTEEAALDFLGQIGVWIADDTKPQSNMPETRLSGAFGYRWFSGRARPLTLETLWADQAYWKSLLRDPVKLAAMFKKSPANDAHPADKVSFALDNYFRNTLPIHLEVGEVPHAVIQPFTGYELLIATAWIDLVRGSNTQVCQRTDCGIPFTGRKRPFCSWYCGHIVSVRRGREKKKRLSKGKKHGLRKHN